MDNRDLVDAPWITLGRTPVSPAAKTLATAMFEALKPRLSGPCTRTIGPKAAPRWEADTGIVLAGLLRSSGGAVSAQRGHSAGVWKDKQPIGYDRFWRLVEAFEASGLIGVREGTKGNARHQPDGYATRLWATDALIAQAASFGVTRDTRQDDWSLDVNLEAKPLQRPRGVVVKPRDDLPIGHIDTAMLEGLARDLEGLNALNASVVIRGAGETVTLYRAFSHSLDFGGRHYGPAYQNVSERERLAITFDGEAAAEVDVKAAQLTLLCALAGLASEAGQLPWADPYDLPGFPRPAVKAWTIRTIGRGIATWKGRQWDRSDPLEVREVPMKKLKGAMLGRCPFFANLAGLVPAGVLDAFKGGRPREVQIGQWVTAQEAGIIASAMAYLVSRGCPVLPVHDSLIVPVSRTKDAEDALQGAYFALAGVIPRLEVARL